MLLIGFEDLGQSTLKEKYPNQFNIVDDSPFDKKDRNWLIQFIESIKLSVNEYDVTYIKYEKNTARCLKALNMPFTLIYTGKSDKELFYKLYDAYNGDKIKLENRTLESVLQEKFDWVIPSNMSMECVQKSLPISEPESIPPVSNKNALTLEELLKEDVKITEEDVRDFKATQNKLKVGMLLQAKTSLNRVLKLSNTLDKLYDKLLDRIDNSLDSTDTASLMYTTDYIAKALSDTNQFIVSLISNEKIQNFFIIKDSNIVNVSDSKIDIDSRERLRKAAEIVMNNIDYFSEGEFNKIKDPNAIDVTPEESIAENKEDKGNANNTA